MKFKFLLERVKLVCITIDFKIDEKEPFHGMSYFFNLFTTTVFLS